MSFNSHVAGLVQLIEDLTLNVGPNPVPLRPQFPFATVQKVYGEEGENLEGRSGLVMTVMQVNCFDKDYETADFLRESIKDLLLGYIGMAGTTGQYVDCISHRNDAELYDDKRELHQLILRLQVWWEKQSINPGELPLIADSRYLPLPSSMFDWSGQVDNSGSRNVPIDPGRFEPVSA